VLGGYWMKCFTEKLKAGELGPGISSPDAESAHHQGGMRSTKGTYNLGGQAISQPLPGEIYIEDGLKRLNNR